MMRRTIFAVVVIGVCLTAGPAMAALFGADGGSRLQSVLDGITVGPNAGVSGVDVTTDEVPDPADWYWSVTGSGGSISTMVFKVAESGYETVGTFGVYDAHNPSNYVQLFNGSTVALGDQAALSIKLDGSVYVNFVDTGVDFTENLFGYYFDTEGLGAGGGGFWYTSGSNADGGDHMYAYRGTNVDTVQLPGIAPGMWTSSEYILAWEIGNINLADRDYDDLVVMVESVQPVPVPAAMLLGMLGLGAAGIRLRRFA